MQVETLPMVPPVPLLSLTCPVLEVSLKKTITETARTRILRGRVGVQHLPFSRSYQLIINRCQPADNHYQLLIVGGAN
jgi:hypothetical protein